MAQNVTLMGATYQDVPKIILPKAGGGDAEFVDVTDTTAAAADVKSGKAFHLADGSLATGSFLWNFKGEDWELINGSLYDSGDVALEDTSFATWTPGTTASTIKASTNLSAFAADMANYEYLIRWRFRFDSVFDTAVPKAQIFRECAEIWQAITRRPNNIDTLGTNTRAGNACTTLYTVPLNVYYNTSGTKTFTFSISYGIYPGAVNAGFSNITSNTPNVTPKTPTVSARCNASYFSTASAGAIDQENSKFRMVGELYRSKPGGVIRSLWDGLIDLYNMDNSR